MDSSRVIEFALGVPDAIARNRRFDAAVRLLARRVAMATNNVDVATAENNALQEGTLQRDALFWVDAQLAMGKLDVYILEDGTKMLDNTFPATDTFGSDTCKNQLVRAVVEFAKANPRLDRWA